MEYTYDGTIRISHLIAIVAFVVFVNIILPRHFER
jgi:hypothetical protein